MNRSEIIDELLTFYDVKKCGHLGCYNTSKCGEKRAIFGPKEPFIGSKYATGRFRRLVVISSDPGSITEDVKCCISRTESGEWIPPANEKKRHWWRTLQIVYSILGRKCLSESTDKDIAAAVNWMAHLNSARCAQNKPRRRQADKKLFVNCKDIVLRELQILKPEFLITLGERAWEVVAELAKPVPYPKIIDHPDCETYCREYKLCDFDTMIRHVNLYHPNPRNPKFSYQYREYILTGAVKAALFR